MERDDAPAFIVPMVVVVGVDGEHFGHALTEQRDKLGMLSD